MGSLYHFDRNRIEQVAKYYKENYGIIPVDIEALTSIVAEYVGRLVQISYGRFDQATIDAVNDRFVINLSDARNVARRRTDCTHELGHILHSYEWAPIGEIPIMRVNYRGSHRERTKEEVICEEIGLYLACPPWAVEKFIENYFCMYQLRLLPVPEVREFLRLMEERFAIPSDDLRTQLANQFPRKPFWQVLQEEKRRLWADTTQKQSTRQG